MERQKHDKEDKKIIEETQKTGKDLPVVQHFWGESLWLKKLLTIGFCCFIGVMMVGLLTNYRTVGSTMLASIRSQELTDVNSIANAVTDGAESGISEGMPGKTRFIDWYGLVQRLNQKRFIQDADYSYSLVKDNSDNLQFITYDANLSQLVQTLGEYQDLGAPLLYIQPPTKFMDDYTEFPINLNDRTASNVANILNCLAEQEVPALDLRPVAEAEQLDRDTMFYRTDHHWTTNTAFWAMTKTVETLESEFGLTLDATGYYTDLNNYQQTTCEDCFLGSIGRRVGQYYAGLDDFTLITPKFNTNYQVEIKDSNSSEVQEGSFVETIIDMDLLNLNATPYTNRYACYFGGDYQEVVIKNQTAPAGGDVDKVLLIKDSYGLPYGAFLSTMVSQLNMIDLRYFDIANLKDYIQAEDFDLILVMYK